MAVSRDETRENLLNAKLSEILHRSGLHSRALQGVRTERGTLGEADLIVDVGGHCVCLFQVRRSRSGVEYRAS